ncbi:MAG: glycosyltransferase [Dehalococcoidia bacterium]|nr:glycosyltransferase [Dehalococcoidia bacterium]
MAPKSTMRARALPLAQVLAAQGHNVTLVLPPWDNPADAGRVWNEGPVQVMNVPLAPAIPLLGHLLLGLRVLWTVLSLHPDVVHAFKPKGFSGFVAQAVQAMQAIGLRRSIRVVVDTDDWEGDGGWNDQEPYPWWQKRLFAWQEHRLLRHAPAVSCASAELVRTTTVVRGSKTGVVYVPNGTTPGWPAAPAEQVAEMRRRLEIAPADPVVLLYTRFVECSAERFLRLLELVRQRAGEVTVLLVGAGLHGEEQVLIADSRRRCGQNPAASPLRNAGWVGAADLPVYLALADVAMFPMEDTLINRTKCSVKLIDLLSAGVPVVAEAVGQCSAYIEDGVGGVLTPAGDDAALAAAVAALLADAPRRAALGRAAAARMRERFTWTQVAEPLMRTYRLS